jgi:hypothetical protein
MGGGVMNDFEKQIASISCGGVLVRIGGDRRK